MKNRRRYLAEVTDPTTGCVTVLCADSEAELDRLVEAHLHQEFPLELPAASADIDKSVPAVSPGR